MEKTLVTLYANDRDKKVSCSIEQAERLLKYNCYELRDERFELVSNGIRRKENKRNTKKSEQ